MQADRSAPPRIRLAPARHWAAIPKIQTAAGRSHSARIPRWKESSIYKRNRFEDGIQRLRRHTELCGAIVAKRKQQVLLKHETIRRALEDARGDSTAVPQGDWTSTQV
jgi:hypothetical protein